MGTNQESRWPMSNQTKHTPGPKHCLETGKNEFVTDPQTHAFGYGKIDSFDPDIVLWVEASSEDEAKQRFASLGFNGMPVAEETAAVIFNSENE